MRAAIFLAALSLSEAAPAQIERLDSDHQPVVRDFRASQGRARLVAILSPT